MFVTSHNSRLSLLPISLTGGFPTPEVMNSENIF